MNELREAIEVLEQLYNIRMGQCGYMPPYETSKEAKALQLAISFLQVLEGKGMPEFHSVKDNYTSFEKYTECEHKKIDALGNNCQACDIAWLIERCKCLEKTIKEYNVYHAKLQAEWREKAGVEKIEKIIEENDEFPNMSIQTLRDLNVNNLLAYNPKRLAQALSDYLEVK